jgi:pilus assembly protein CpaB
VRTSTIVMIAFAVVFGLLAVFLANAWLNNRADEARRSLEASRKEAPPERTIVVARRPLRFGDVLGAMSLREMAWPQDALPAGAFSRISDLTATKRIVLIPIQVNEAILASKITGPGERATLSAVLGSGMKAVTVRVNDVEGVAGFVQPGDHVDVVLTRPGEHKSSVNDVIAQDVRVLAVDQLADPTSDKPVVVKAVTLEVDETAGQKLTLAPAVGTLSLLLRKAGEVAEDAPRQMTAADLGQVKQTEDARFVTVVVKRPTSVDATGIPPREEFNVPVEHRDTYSAALPAPAREMTHD